MLIRRRGNRDEAAGAPDMTPRKDETPEEFRARQRARYAAAIRSIGKGGWHGRGNGNGTSCFWF